MPVPRTLHLGDADGALGAPFYVMERVRRAHLPQRAARRLRRHARASARRSAKALVDALAALHTDRPRPRWAWRSSAGPPASWSASCAAGRSSGSATKVAELPALDALRDELVRTLPRAARSHAIVHGDYRLDNTILHPTRAGPHRRGARLGDEHARRPVHRPRRAAGVLERGRRPGRAVGGADRRAGDRGRRLPVARGGRSSATRSETGFDVSDIAWYQAFALFKLAVVCQGIAARAAGGAMVGSGFDDAQRLVAPLVDAGRHVLGARV